MVTAVSKAIPKAIATRRACKLRKESVSFECIVSKIASAPLPTPIGAGFSFASVFAGLLFKLTFPINRPVLALTFRDVFEEAKQSAPLSWAPLYLSVIVVRKFSKISGLSLQP